MAISGAEALTPLVLMGGTFDPVHFGHLRTALELQQRFSVPVDVCFVPAWRHRLKTCNAASPEHRLSMLRIALDDVPGMRVEPLELERACLTSTVETLEILRQRHGPRRPLAFVMGSDAWNTLPRWHRWLEIVQLAHIIVVNRPAHALEQAVLPGGVLHTNPIDRLDDLLATPGGGVAFVTLTQLEISSSAIRDSLRRGLSPRFLLPDAVIAYIAHHELYAS